MSNVINLQEAQQLVASGQASVIEFSPIEGLEEGKTYPCTATGNVVKVTAKATGKIWLFPELSINGKNTGVGGDLGYAIAGQSVNVRVGRNDKGYKQGTITGIAVPANPVANPIANPVG